LINTSFYRHISEHFATRQEKKLKVIFLRVGKMKLVDFCIARGGGKCDFYVLPLGRGTFHLQFCESKGKFLGEKFI
jgi:hypothetical protein